MSNAIFIAVVLGVAAGVVGGYRSCKALSLWLSASASAPQLVQRCAWAGTFLFLLPAFSLSIVVGGNFGGGWAAAATEAVGLGSVGVPVGLAVGIAVVLVVGLSIGSTVGGLLGRALSNAHRQPAEP